MVVFPERLLQLRKLHQKTQKQMADELGINVNTYASYERETRNANAFFFVKVSQIFDVSVDYLLGLSDIPKVQTNEELEKRTGICENAYRKYSVSLPKREVSKWHVHKRKDWSTFLWMWTFSRIARSRF